MKVDELRKLPDVELVDFLARDREELFNLKFQATTEPVENSARVRILRKEIARISTILTGRKLGNEEAG